MRRGHDAWCKWPNGEPCRRFSTDGTRLGADIAHTMGTTNEAVIAAGQAPNDEDFHGPFRSDVADEQADWDAEDEEYDNEKIYNHVCGRPDPCHDWPACQQDA